MVLIILSQLVVLRPSQQRSLDTGSTLRGTATSRSCPAASVKARNTDGIPASGRLGRDGRTVETSCLPTYGRSTVRTLHSYGAELLFQVLTEREETNSVAFASNESFSGWTKTFTDPRLCAAIVDRLTFGGNIIETGTDSYRFAHAHQKNLAMAAD